MLTHLLAIAQHYPTATLAILAILAVILALLLARFTTRPQSDNGLRYEYQIKRTVHRQ